MEKAFTLSSAEADRIVAAQKQSGTVLTVFQSKSRALRSADGADRRYDSDFRTLEYLINHPDKPLGTITECEIHYDVDAPAWAMRNKSAEHSPGGGMMFGIGCHTCELVRQCF